VSDSRRLHHSYEDYLQAQAHSDLRLEFLDGEIFAMAGGTPAHADLAAAAIRLLGNALGDRCRVSTSDLKVRVEATGLTTYPDASVVCGPRQTARIDPHAMTNPTVLVEVTSPSTEDYDRGDKLSHYKQIPSLQAVIFVSHRLPQVTVIQRGRAGWEERHSRSGEQVKLTTPEIVFAVDDLYRGIALEG
jgi:Uma2 family endonuclease